MAQIFLDVVGQKDVLPESPRTTSRPRKILRHFRHPASGQRVHRHFLLKRRKHQGKIGESQMTVVRAFLQHPKRCVNYVN